MNIVSRSSASNRPQREATLRLFRDNSLAAVLDPNFSIDGDIQDHEVRRAEAVAVEGLASDRPDIQDFIPRRPPRRIFGSDPEE